MSTWEGFSPWWAAFPVAMLLMYGLLQANYERFVAMQERGRYLETEVHVLRQRLDARVRQRGIADRLADFIEQGDGLAERIRQTSKRVPDEDYESWYRTAYEFLSSACGRDAAADFRAAHYPVNRDTMAIHVTEVWNQRNEIMAKIELLQRTKGRYE